MPTRTTSPTAAPTRMFRLPSAAEVEASTQPGRDRVLDLVRIVSLVVVITAHSVMAVVHVRVEGGAHVVSLDNLLGLRPGLQPLTWLLQVLPLFFFAGAAASAIPWISPEPSKRPERWGPWLLGRCRRLYRPLAVYVVFWAVVLVVLSRFAGDGVLGPLRGLSTQLAWFLGVYVLVLACVPLLARIRTVAALVGVVAGLAVAVASVDAVRLTHLVPDIAGAVNYVMAWLVPATLGVGYIRGLLRPVQCAVVGAVALATDVLLVAVGPYEVSLVTVPGQLISNMTPPSLLIVGHSVALCCLLVVAHAALARIAARPTVWRWVAVGNSGAMSLYLWHLPCVVVVFALVWSTTGVEGTGDAWFWPLLLLRLALVYAATFGMFLLMSPIENARWSWWDAPLGRVGAATSALVGGLLVASGALVLLHAKTGLDREGATVLGVALVLAVAARMLCRSASAADSTTRVPSSVTAGESGESVGRSS